MTEAPASIRNWSEFSTDSRIGVVAEVVSIPGGQNDEIHAYYARPVSDFSRGAIVLIHHLPGWDELYFEFAERLARHGYDVIAFDTYCRYGHGSPEDVATRVRALGGLSDDEIVADATAAASWLRSLPANNGKVAVMGSCSGGRYSVLAASRTPFIYDAVVDLWGGMVVMTPDQLTDKRPVAPIAYTADLVAPLLGIFGNDDQRPSAEQVDEHEAALVQHHKAYEFYRYDGAGHGFIYYDHALFRFPQAMEAWERIFEFLRRQLAA